MIYKIRDLSEDDARRLAFVMGVNCGANDVEVEYGGERFVMPRCQMNGVPAWADATCLDPELVKDDSRTLDEIGEAR
jgi:hypothetical protein